MSRGANAAVAVAQATTWTTLFDATTDGGYLTAAGFGGVSTNTDRVYIRWTMSNGNVNYLSIGSTDWKPIKAGLLQIAKIEAQSPSDSQSVYFDACGDNLAG